MKLSNHSNQLLSLLLLFGFGLINLIKLVSGFTLPPSQIDPETNRVLEEFIWQKIIGAPTDPKKAYQELRSSLAAISTEANLEKINLPETLYSIEQILSPRSLRRRSSYASPDSSNGNGGGGGNGGGAGDNSVVTSSTSPPISTESSNNNQQQQQQQQQQVYNSPTTSNKYIPEYGAKDLYHIMATSAGLPDKQPQIPIPPPPLPPPKRIVDENTVTSDSRQATFITQQQQQQQKSATPTPITVSSNTIQKISPPTTSTTVLSSSSSSSSPSATKTPLSYSGPINVNRNYFTMHKINRGAKKIHNPIAAASNQLDHQTKLDETPNNSNNVVESPPSPQQPPAVASAPIVKEIPVAHRGQQQAQSQSIYDILPMPSYGHVKGAIFPGTPIGGHRHHQQSPFEDGDGGSFFSGGGHHGGDFGLPPSPGQLAHSFDPIIEQQKERPNLQEPIDQHYIPVQPPPPPQIIDVIPDEQPIQIVFRSSSARVNVKQVHTPTLTQEVETTRTEEKPQRVLHQLVRPIVQEVVEIIQPYRRVTQEIRPVLEEIRTVVAKQAEQSHRPRIEQLGTGHGKW